MLVLPFFLAFAVFLYECSDKFFLETSWGYIVSILFFWKIYKIKIYKKIIFDDLNLHRQNIQVHSFSIKNIRSLKPCKEILVSMFSILEHNGEKRKIKLSLFNNFLISLDY